MYLVSNRRQRLERKHVYTAIPCWLPHNLITFNLLSTRIDEDRSERMCQWLHPLRKDSYWSIRISASKHRAVLFFLFMCQWTESNISVLWPRVREQNTHTPYSIDKQHLWPFESIIEPFLICFISYSWKKLINIDCVCLFVFVLYFRKITWFLNQRRLLL